MKFFITYLFAGLLIGSSLMAEIPYSIDPLLNYQPNTTGFNCVSFWEGMRWQRNTTPSSFTDDRDVKIVEQNYIRFCQNLHLLPTQDYTLPPRDYSIPPIIHLIWLGSPIPSQVLSSFNSWEKWHPGWEIKIWTDKELINFPWSTQKLKLAFKQATTWAEKADILRLEVLYTFGGIYSDADVVCLNSFHDIVIQDVTFFSCFELNYIGKHYGEPFFVGSAIMGAAKNSPIAKYCLDHIRTEEEAPTVGIIKRTGPGLISRGCQAFLSDTKENILILPCSYLYPLPWKKKETSAEEVLEYIAPESLAIHLWDGSWCVKKKKD